MADTLARLWYRVAGQAVARTLQGDSRRAVMEDAVRALADKGLETVDYASRRRTSVDAATRRHMVTQASQARARLLVQRCDEHGVALVFTSAHYGARPSHAAWQGRPFGLRGPCEVGGVRYPGLAEATGYGSVAGLCGANCRHTFHPYSPGNTRLPDTRLEAEEAAFGQTSEERYEALQRQRELERRVRKYKRRVAVGQEAGLDMAPDRARLGRAQAEVRAWCRANRLPRRYDLERAYGVKEQPRALGRKAPGLPKSVERSLTVSNTRPMEIEVRGSAMGKIRFEKTLERIRSTEPRDEFAIESLAKAGVDVTTRREAAPDGFSNIDLLIDGQLWEVKSPDGCGKRAVEKALRKAAGQFRNDFNRPGEPVRVVFNARYYGRDDDWVVEEMSRRMAQHGVTSVLVVKKDGSVVLVRPSQKGNGRASGY